MAAFGLVTWLILPLGPGLASLTDVVFSLFPGTGAEPWVCRLDMQTTMTISFVIPIEGDLDTDRPS